MFVKIIILRRDGKKWINWCYTWKILDRNEVDRGSRAISFKNN